MNDRVHVIGNAKSILGKKYGWEIDDHFTIRLNECPFWEYPTSLGNRIDALCCVNRNYKSLKRTVLKDPNVIFITYVTRELKAANKNRNTLINLVKPEYPSGKTPSIGFLLFNTLKAFHAKDVHFYGFDWKSTGTWYAPVNPKRDERHAYDFEREEMINGIEASNWTLHT